MKVKLYSRVLNISIGNNPRRQTSTTQGYKKLVPRYDKCLNSGVNMLKNSSTLAVSVPINLFIKFGFVSANSPRETYFVDALRSYVACYLTTAKYYS